MKKINIVLSFVLLTQITHFYGAAALAAPEIMGMMGGAGGMPPMSFGLSFTEMTNKMNQTCYGDVKVNVQNKSGTVQIAMGNCTLTGGQTMSNSQSKSGKMGKAGDITIVDFSTLKLIQNFGNVTELVGQIFTVPQISTTGWNNAVYFTFKPSNPQIGSALAQRGISGAAFKGRDAQVVIRTRYLTKELSTQEAHDDTWIEGEDQVLVEVWARTNPSLTGSPEITQIFNFVLGATDIGKNGLIFAADQFGQAAISLNAIDAQGQTLNVTDSFNVLDETNKL